MALARNLAGRGSAGFRFILGLFRVPEPPPRASLTVPATSTSNSSSTTAFCRQQQFCSTSNDDPGSDSALNVGMDAFARLEAKLRAKKREEAAATTPQASDDGDSLDAFDAGIDAFARLEAQLRAKKRQEQNAAASPPGPRGGPKIPQQAPPPYDIKPLLRTKPEAPEPYECCGNSCENCVWTVYWEELEQWNFQEHRRKLAEQQMKQPEPNIPVDSGP